MGSITRTRFWFCVSVSTVGLTLGGLGCGVKLVNVPILKLETPPLQTFPKQSMELYDNQLFIWPEKVTQEQVSTVLAMGDDIRHLEQAISPLRASLDELNKKLASDDDLIRSKNVSLNAKKNKVRKGNENFKRYEADLNNALDQESKERAKQDPDPKVLKELAIRIEKDLKILGNIWKEIQQSQGMVAQLEKEISALSSTPDFLERDKINQSFAADEKLKLSKISEIKQIVEWFEPQPQKFSFYFDPDGVLHASIVGWGVGGSEKGQDFSSKPQDGSKPTIENTKYSETGGVLEFDVKVYADSERTQILNTYSFRIARNSYDSPDGKIYFAGDIKRISYRPDGSTEVREGMANLIDKRN